MKIKKLNEKTYNKINELARDDLSYPLLISPILEKENNSNKILYIGQETNTWYKNKSHINLTFLENKYYSFLKDNATHRNFWQFINEILNYEPLISNIIWANCFICGKKEKRGTPIVTNELIQISIDYLVEIYNELKPNKILIVCGSNYPYYIVIESFLRKIGVNNKELLNTCLSKDNLYHSFKTADNTTTVFWTYHPTFLYINKKACDIKIQIKEEFNL
ncbi:MAG: hypothetical protein KHZ15_13600 [Coprobacillus cateniformis]|nr:hypothetical protein [Coprobacillus cateniformis]